MRVLIVEDDRAPASDLVVALQTDGAVVEHTKTGEEALELLQLRQYDIVLVDLLLADMDGYEIVRGMRTIRVETPVMVLSGDSGPLARLKGFDIEAADFVFKPFDIAEMLSRLRVLARRSRGISQPKLCVGSVTLNLENRRVTIGGRPLQLTPKEYAVLEFLIMRKGSILSKVTVLNHLYGGGRKPDIKIIDIVICKLRKKLKLAGVDNLIGTVWGGGYSIRGSSDNRGVIEPVQTESELPIVPIPRPLNSLYLDRDSGSQAVRAP